MKNNLFLLLFLSVDSNIFMVFHQKAIDYSELTKFSVSYPSSCILPVQEVRKLDWENEATSGKSSSLSD